MSFKISGIVKHIGNTEKINDNYSMRMLAVEVSEVGNDGRVFISDVAFQFANNRCGVLDNYSVGDEVDVSFNIRSNRFDKNGRTGYFTNLTGFYIEKVGGAKNQIPVPAVNSSAGDESLPF